MISNVKGKKTPHVDNLTDKFYQKIKEEIASILAKESIENIVNNIIITTYGPRYWKYQGNAL